MPSQNSLDTVQNIYIAFYGRPADPAGLEFWANALDAAEGDVSVIINDFADSAEYQENFGDLENEELVNNLYQQAFGRDAEPAGLTYWVGELEAGNISLGGIALEVLLGAQNEDLQTIQNKKAVADAFTAAVAAEGKDYSGETAVAAAKALIDGITDETVPAEVDVAAVVGGLEDAPDPVDPVDPGVPGEEFLLTASTDILTGTADNDQFYAYLQQNQFAGGVSNSLSSADRIDGGAGYDSLFAEIVPEFFGATGDRQIDVQPRTVSVEQVEFEARDAGSNNVDDTTVTVDAKHMLGLDRIGSKQSDGNLVIENLTTLMNDGTTKRNTSDLTITMNHTDNKNSDNDASDLVVYFDDNYLISGESSQGEAIWYILDQDSDQIGGPLLADIDVNGIRFSFDGGPEIRLSSDAANEANTHVEFVAALQTELAAAIADGRIPSGTTLTLDTTRVDTTFLDDGSRSSDIPAIVLTSGDGSQVTPVGFSRVEDAVGEYNVYGRLADTFDIEPEPVSVNVELTKVGRGGEGGDLIVGSKAQIVNGDIGNGIPVINATVIGGEELPNNMGILGTTNGRLEVLNIKSEAGRTSADIAARGYASLEIRESFDQDRLNLVNANEFRGDLTIGSDIRAENVITLTATGGGDVEFYAEVNGEFTNADGDQERLLSEYSYTTGAGDDTIDVVLDLNAVEHQETGLTINAGSGDNTVVLTATNPTVANYENHKDLENVSIQTEGGSDDVFIFGIVDTTIETSAGNDTVYAGSSYTDGDTAVNAFNAQSAVWNFNNHNTNPVNILELDGQPLTQSMLFKSELTVTFSGAGVAAINDAAGGGVMAGIGGAVAGDDGIESTVRIDLAANQFYGTQDDINKAMLRAINEHPVLSKLLIAEIGPDYTLQVRTLIDGVFDATDLNIEIAQPAFGDLTSGEQTALIAAVREFENDSTIGNTEIWGVANPADSDTLDAILFPALTDADYNGIDTEQLAQSGAATDSYSDNIINVGTGNDVVVLGTTVGVDAAVSSNDTLVFEGNFGFNTVVNFATDGAGIDFLDFTAYLTTLEHTTTSGSTASQDRIATTLNADTVLEANEVAVLTFTTAGTDTFANLNATNLLSALNDGGTNYGGFSDITLDSAAAGVFTANVVNNIVGNSYNSIVMVENDQNLGEYKVFEVTTTADSAASNTDFATIELLGTVDFGATLTGLATANLV